MANGGNNSVSVLLGNGNGTFQTHVDYSGTGSNPRSIALGDFNGDGKLDIATANGGDYTNGLSILLGTGTGTFASPVNYNLAGNNNYSYQVIAKDLNGDGKLDLVLADNTSRLTVAYGNGDGTFNPITYNMGNQEISAAVADFNGDGLPDIAVINYANTTGGNSVTLLDGESTLPLTADPAGSGVRSGYGRGNLSSTSDADFYSFTANAGDTLTLAADSLSVSAYTGLQYYVYDAAGNVITNFSSYYYGEGYGQSSPVVLATGGNYRIRVTYNYDYEGEYRFRVTLAAPNSGIQMETESNDSTGSANTPTLTLASGHLKATVGGAITTGDGGDFYNLGNATVGTAITLTESQPSTSSLSDILAIVNSAGTVVATSAAGATSLSYTIPSGANGTYYARVTASGTTAGLLSQYILGIDLYNTLSPTITSVSFPAEGTTTNAVLDRFTVTFSEDLNASTVNNPANFDLRAAGPDGTFGTADDILYHVTPQTTYTAGTTETYLVSDGPLQPGSYQLTIGTGLMDKSGNPLLSPYVRHFTTMDVAPYVLESRSDNTLATATPIAAVTSTFSGSFTAQATTLTTGTNPYTIATGDLNGDGKADLVVANYSSNTISVFLGNGDGTFAPKVNYAAGTNPYGVALADLNGDGKLDVVVTDGGASNVSVLLGTGTGTFGSAVSYATGSSPFRVTVADLNGDGKPDLVVANSNASTVSVLLGKGDGTFQTHVDYAVASANRDAQVGDVNGDGKPDLVVADYNSNAVSVLLGNGNGTFQTHVDYTGTGNSPNSVALGDFNGDGKLDIAVANYDYTNGLSILLNTGTGTFATPVNYNLAGNNNYGWQVIAKDLNGDGKLDLVLATNTSRLQVAYGNGDGTFNAITYNMGNQELSAAVGDFNGDGRPDIALINYTNTTGGNSVTILTGDPTIALTADPAGSGVRSGYARGNLSGNGTDTDYFSFTANAGDTLTVAAESPGSVGYSGLYYYVFDAAGNQVAEFNGYYYSGGYGQSSPVVLATGGTYRVRVTTYEDYEGEYRLRVTLASAASGIQMETESNDSTGSANTPTLTLVGGHLKATIDGAVTTGDGGDFYSLGNIAYGTTITLTESQPGLSSLSDILAIVNSAGTVVATSAAGATTFSYAIPSGANGTYYVRVTANGSTAGLLSQYLLGIDLVNTQPPTITSISFPAEGTTTNAVLDRFTVTFSEDLNASTINNPSNFDLRAAGPDGTFGTADDILYHVTPQTTYTAGTTETYLVSDGPLQPGSYQLTIGTGITDKFGNPLASPSLRHFTTVDVAPYLLESRSDNTAATATPLAATTSAFSGSFTAQAATLTTGTNPYTIATGDLNGDGKADLVVANYSSNTISVFLGNGDGTFAPKVDYAAGTNPYGVALADLNGDGKLDVVVTDGGASNVSVLLGTGTGTFGSAVSYATGSSPFRVTVADLNGDGKPDLVVANSNASTVSVLLGKGDGTFQTHVDYAVASANRDAQVGDVNGDGKPDLVVADYNSNAVSVLLGNGNGTFQTHVDYTGTGNSPNSVALGDFNGDGKLDIAVANYDYTNGLSILLNTGTGTFATPVNYNLAGNNNYGWQVIAKDLNGDGKLDLVLATNTSRLQVAYGNGDGTFNAITYNMGNQELSAAVGDFNGDGRPDIALINYTNTTGGNSVTILTGDPTIALTADPAGSGVRSGYARGNLSGNGTDTDYFSFTANAGDTLTVAAESPGSVGYSGLYYYVFDAAGNQVAEFNGYYYSGGYGQSSPVVLATGGTYRVRVTTYEDYEGEYRLRVTLAAPGTQMETETNDAITSANTLTFAQASGSQLVASVAGAITTSDGGDYYFLGNLPAGVAINLSTLLPGTSNLSPKVKVVLGPSGTVLADGDGNPNDGTAQDMTTVAGAYYAVVLPRTSSVGLLATYILNVKMTDATPPSITGDTLPAQGTISTAVIDRFSLNFTEDMIASTVNASTSYDLRSAGADGIFGTADDAVYHLTPLTTYVNGFTASFKITDGPLQPGNYRFTATTAIQNRFGTPLASSFVQGFSVAPLTGYTIEGRSDDTIATSNLLSTTPSSSFAGSFTAQPTFATGNNPYGVVSADLNNDGHLDLVTANYGTNTITVFLGSGGGTFTPMTPIVTGSEPVAIAVADFNGDGKLDLAVANNGTNTVSILLGNGNGTFGTPTNIVVGSNPYHLIATDLNGDGKADIAVAVGGTNMIAVLINKGDGTGTFKPVVDYSTGAGTNPTDVAFADVNGDGKKDLIVPCYNTSNIVILKGNGDGTFQAAGTPIPTGSNPRLDRRGRLQRRRQDRPGHRQLQQCRRLDPLGQRRRHLRLGGDIVDQRQRRPGLRDGPQRRRQARPGPVHVHVPRERRLRQRQRHVQLDLVQRRQFDAGHRLRRLQRGRPPGPRRGRLRQQHGLPHDRRRRPTLDRRPRRHRPAVGGGPGEHVERLRHRLLQLQRQRRRRADPRH